MKVKIISIVTVLFMALFITEALAFKELNDQELDFITAGSANMDYDSIEALARVPIRYSSRKGNVDGEAIVLPLSTFNETASLELMDNAQSNLRSLININAVNSPVQVLLNLNINVHSTIDKVIQLNSLLSD